MERSGSKPIIPLSYITYNLPLVASLIADINPLKHVGKSFIPCLFIAGEDDNFIPPSHSEALHAAYAGDKNLIIVDGDHNSPRPKFMFDSGEGCPPLLRSSPSP